MLNKYTIATPEYHNFNEGYKSGALFHVTRDRQHKDGQRYNNNEAFADGFDYALDVFKKLGKKSD